MKNTKGSKITSFVAWIATDKEGTEGLMGKLVKNKWVALIISDLGHEAAIDLMAYEALKERPDIKAKKVRFVRVDD